MKRKLNFYSLVIFCSLIILSILLPSPAIISAASPQSSRVLRNGSSSIPTIGTWECGDDGSVDPCHNTLYDADFLSANYGWAVGQGGLILFWNGSSWTKVASPTTNTLRGVSILSENNAWIAGETGTILHWEGSNWTQVVVPPLPYWTSTTNLYDVETYSGACSATDPATCNIVYFSSGVFIFKQENGSWYSSGPVTSGTIYSFSLVPGTYGQWLRAVGPSGAVLKFDGKLMAGASVEMLPGAGSNRMYTIVMISQNEAWTAGYNGKVFHMTSDGIWEAVSGPYSSISNAWSLDAAASNDIWMTGFDNGYSNIYHWNGTSWSISHSDVGPEYYAIRVVPGAGGSVAWAVGAPTEILAWNGSNWSVVNHPFSASISDIAFASQEEGWAASSGWPVSFGRLLSWNGNTWSVSRFMDANTIDLVPCSNGMDGWAGGMFGEMYQKVGATWSSVTLPFNPPVEFYQRSPINSIRMNSSSDGWAVGGHTGNPNWNAVLFHWDGSNWSQYDIGSFSIKTLQDVDFTSSSYGWAVGSNGTFLKWNGNVWTLHSTAYTGTLYGVDLLSENSGWAVGENGLILHWDGTEWSIVSSPVTNSLYSITMLSDTDGWIVGNAGVILKWDGSSWIKVDSPTTEALLAISATTTDIWAAGSNGVILRYNWPNIPPAAFRKSCLTNNASNQPLNLSLSWKGSPGATSYEYCYDTVDNDICDGTWMNIGTDSTASISGLSPATTYYWQVRAVNNYGTIYADDGNWWLFTTGGTFSDVTADHWAWLWIERLYAAGITGGCNLIPLQYCPENAVTRAQMAVFLERGMHGSTFSPPDVAPTFGDTAGHWAEDWIEALFADGITAGCGGGNYCPEQPTTRAQMAIFLLRSKHGAGYTPPDVAPTFGDTAGHWAEDWIEQLALEGITAGCGGGNYCPEDPVKRSEMAVFLVRTFNLP